MSEMKQILIDLIESERSLQFLAHFSFEGIIFYGQGKAFEVNNAMSRMTGLDRESILSGMLVDTCIPNQTHKSLYMKAIMGTYLPFEIEMRRTDSQMISVEIESQEFTYRNEVITVVSVRDITGKKKVENELNKLSVAVDQSANVVVITNTKGLIEYVNRSFTEVTGYTPEEAIGQNPRILKSGNHPQSFYQNLWKTLKKGEQWKGEILNRKKSGETYWEAMTITPVRNKDDEVINYIAVKEDITNQKKAEKSLHESEELFRSMVSNIPGVLYRCAMDKSRTMYYITGAIETLSGYQAEEYLNNRVRSYASIIHPDDRERVILTILSELLKSKQYNIEYRIITADQTVKWVSDSGRPLYNDNHQVKWLDGFIIDISDRVNVLEELRKAKIQAEEANKAKSEFLANISHEIRTPLNTVLGFTELLEGMTLEVNQLQYLNSIKSSGKNLMTLINDLLDLSKIETGKVNIHYAPVSIRGLMSEIRNIFMLKISQKGIAYNEKIGDKFPPEIMFDETRLRQILINLVGNAIKFTHEGHVDLIVDAKHGKAQKGIRTLQLEIKITDTGIGIKKESFQVIFDSFRQQSQLDSRQYEGTGLGLAITKRLVEAMGGQILLESEVGIGTTFTLVFPHVEYVKRFTAPKKGGLEKVEADADAAEEQENDVMITDAQGESRALDNEEYNMLMNIMENKLFQQWKHFETKKPLKEIKAFAQELILLGQNHKVRIIQEFGEQLYLTIENFDIEEMQLKLQDFPVLMRNMKKLYHES